MRSVLFAGGLALLISLLGTRFAITAFTRIGAGQPIRDDGPTSHHTKRGTPTMGGLVIIVATLVAYFGAKLILRDPVSASALLLLFLFVGLGAVGFLDDYIKISKQRSLGLRSKAKVGGQTLVDGRARGFTQYPGDIDTGAENRQHRQDHHCYPGDQEPPRPDGAPGRGDGRRNRLHTHPFG